jgi:hypothetical protein
MKGDTLDEFCRAQKGCYVYVPTASERAYIFGSEGNTIKYWPRRGRFFEHTLRKYLEDTGLEVTDRFGIINCGEQE